ncbi:PD-(D/E)XK nuclease family protein [Methylobacterium persicinum]
MGAAAGHRLACEALIAGPEDAEPPEADGSLACLDTLFDDLEMAEPGGMAGRFDDYPSFFTALARERKVACSGPSPHPRLRILGLIEARLLQADRIVVGGLDEGVWPVRTVTDAFLNRPMRERIGLDPPERRIGQMAHDFTEALGCRDAVITRALKRDGAPTVPSRLIQRMRAFAGEEAWSTALTAGRRLAGLAAALDTAPPQPRLRRPAPKPDPALFPRTLSVTEIETLVRDPYAIFARHVLGLDPLEPLAALPGAGERGSLVHRVFSEFTTAYPQGLPAQAEERLYQIAVAAFAPISDTYPSLFAEWWPRYARMAQAYLPWEADRRPGLRRVHAEVSGRWAIPMGRETFTLRARADRIELRPDGTACIVDFKTGRVPSAKEIFTGFSPQLTLEAAMLMHGAFRDLPAAKATPDLLYVHASGGGRPSSRSRSSPAGGGAQRRGDRGRARRAPARPDRPLSDGRGRLHRAPLSAARQPRRALRSPRPGEGMVPGWGGRGGRVGPGFSRSQAGLVSDRRSLPPPHPEVLRSSLEGGLQGSRSLLEPSFEAR